jgi:hypothetical protein
MGGFNRQSVLTSFGNYVVAAAGRTVFPDDSEFPNAKAGEILVMSNGVTIGAGSIPTATNISIAFGVGPVGGNATSLRYLAGEEINLCDSSIKPRVTVPACGTPQVVDTFLTGCFTPNDQYTLAINLDDSYVRSHYQENEKPSYVYSVSSDACSSCNDCDASVSCTDMVCKIVDAINGKHQEDPTKITRFIRADLTKQYQPFRAARLFLETTLGAPETTREFCLTPTDSACVDCSVLTGIIGVTIEDTDYDFTGTTLVGNTAITLPSQIKQVVAELNRVLEPIGGSAFLKQSIGKCCDISIEVNSCADIIELRTANAEEPIVACASTNPFTDIDIAAVCKSCTDEGTTITPTCGFRVFVDPVEVPCDCTYPPNLPAPNYYGRTVDIQPVGDGWGCQSFYTKVSTDQVLPEGFGYFWQDLAHYGQTRGGSGRDFRYNNIHRGNIGLPDASSRSTNAANGIVCDETYCVYNLVTTTMKNRFFNNAGVNVNQDIDYVLIPSGDSTTKTSWETMLTALQARGICNAGTITCA